MITLIAFAFILGLIAISAEQRLGVSKSATAVFLGGLIWAIIAANGKPDIIPHLTEAGAEIIEILLFLLSAMALVEVLAHYRFFDIVRFKIAQKRLDYKKQLWTISAIAFVLSGIIDNLTTTIILTQLARLFFKGKNLIIAAALIVISANAGGAFSPIGDVTTTMLWLQDKFASYQVIQFGLIPSGLMYLIAAFLLIPKMNSKDMCHPSTINDVKLYTSEKLVIAIAFGSFSLPFIFNIIGLKPYLGLLTGLGITWITIDVLKKSFSNHSSHFSAALESFLQKTDISSLMFFAGILLAVSGLDFVGILESISEFIFGLNPEFMHMVYGSALLGIASAIVDNVPLTAASIKILHTADPQIWVLIALAVGTGGSLLAIGSAAGIVAMGIVKEMTFMNYLKIASIPALISYIIGITVWLAQHFLYLKFIS